MCAGVDSESYLDNVCGGDGEGKSVRYYIRVMRLFEQFPSPNGVIGIAESAISVVNKDDPDTVSALIVHNYI